MTPREVRCLAARLLSLARSTEDTGVPAHGSPSASAHMALLFPAGQVHLGAGRCGDILPALHSWAQEPGLRVQVRPGSRHPGPNPAFTCEGCGKAQSGD